MFKLGALLGDQWVEHSHPPVFKVEEGLRGKVFATAPGGDPLTFESLAKCLTPPLMLLYVLHTPRGEARPGRYQSPPMSGDEFREFVGHFRNYLQADGRFDLWVHSEQDDATVVWDRHNLIHAYGQRECMIETLRALGFDAGEPGIDFAHQHHYRPSQDENARELLAYFPWSYSSLESADEQ
jgi:hypothetical protein